MSNLKSMATTLIAGIILASGIPVGAGMVTVQAGPHEIELYTYKPPTYKGERMIMVFHGVLRNADTYRDHARGMGDRFDALIVTPKFDDERFPSAKYQLGGLLNGGRLAPPEEWTWSLIPQIARRVREMERSNMPFYLIGHSAGGQFVVRMAGFVDTGAERMVTANPGSLLFPTRDMPYPYGFGGLPEEVSSDGVIRRYLAQPLTFYQGTADVQHDQYFGRGELSMRQGDSRLNRGMTAFEMGRALAEQNGWDFGWTQVFARGIGHDHNLMFNHPVCEVALFGSYAR